MAKFPYTILLTLFLFFIEIELKMLIAIANIGADNSFCEQMPRSLVGLHPKLGNIFPLMLFPFTT